MADPPHVRARRFAAPLARGRPLVFGIAVGRPRDRALRRRAHAPGSAEPAGGLGLAVTIGWRGGRSPAGFGQADAALARGGAVVGLPLARRVGGAPFWARPGGPQAG
jgi:hypothetical protein